jgi:pimeloyl-ACP methyl ester carboxylesterase
VRRWLAGVGIGLGSFGLAWTAFQGMLPERNRGVFPDALGTPYIHLSRVGGPSGAGTALLVHGLNSSKEFMQLLAMALADGGLDTWAIDLPGHGDSPRSFDSARTLRAIEATLDSLPADTLVVGHSMGAALVAELAMSRRIEAAVLLSPPPIPLGQADFGRLLVLSGRFDAPRINAFIPALIEASGEAAQWRKLPWAGHSTALVTPVTHRMIAGWAGARTDAIRTRARLLSLGLMVASALALFALGASWARRRPTGPLPDADRPLATPASEVMARIGALAGALLLLAFWNPLSWLSLFRTDYLVGVLLVSGLLLWRGRSFRLGGPGALAALGAAAWVLGAIALISPGVMHLVPSGEQWLRFPVLAAAGFPLFLYEERVIRPIRPAWRMWGTFILGRILTWAAVTTGVLLWANEAMFLVLITHLVLLAWIPLWWLAGFVARAAGEPGAAALFASLVQGWVFAALFVTI